MHKTALLNAKNFFDTYASKLESPVIVDIGAQDVNGSIKDMVPAHASYIGVDFVAGKGVDIILDDPYSLPFEDNSIDLIVSSSCFEHSEMFWLLYLEIMRVLKPSGLLYVNVPSNGPFHRYPVDCWRFYPDSGNALVNWGKRNGLESLLMESYISRQYRHYWNDFVGVILKDKSQQALYPDRIIESKQDFYNGLSSKVDGVINRQKHPEGFVKAIFKLKKLKWSLAERLSKYR